MKKKMAMGLLMLTVLILTLTACSSGKKDETDSMTESTTSSETTKATEPVTSSAQETDTALAQPEQSSSGSEDGITLQGVRDAVAEAYGESYLPSMPLDGESLEQIYGVTADMYEEAFGEVPMISAQVDTLILVKAKEGKAGDVKTALENYRTYQLEEGLHYPMNVPKLEASEVVVYGDYVCYIMLGTIDETIEDEGEMLTAHKEQNEIGKAVLERMLTQ